MKLYKKGPKTDLEQLQFLHGLNKVSKNYTRNAHKQPYNLEMYGPNENNNRTIYLERTNPISIFPIGVKLLKKSRKDFSISPEPNIYHSFIGYDNNSFSFNSNNKNKYNNNFEKTPPQRNTYNIRLTNNDENEKYIDARQINKLKHSLGNPKQARNIIVNNNIRNNRFIADSPGDILFKDNIKNKSDDLLRYNENEVNDNKHKIRNLLSKNYKNKFSLYKLKKPYNNDYNNKRYDNRSFSYRLYPNNIEQNNIKRYNMVTSPGVRSSKSDINCFRTKEGNRNIMNSLKQISPDNITPTIDSNTPLIITKKKIIREEIPLGEFNNNRNIFINDNNNNYSYNNFLDIKMDDLIFIENRLNDIIFSLNNHGNNLSIGTMNESVEFFVYYFHSSLKGKFSSFFSDKNRITIKSAFNLNLFAIIITYHLSLNPPMLIKVIILLKKIYELLKMNLFLFIKKIELYYGEDFARSNKSYFRSCNYFLNKNGLYSLYEAKIIDLISRNCVAIVNIIGNLLNFYKSIYNEYFNDFQDIYLNISKIDEQDLHNYFYDCLFNSKKENKININRQRVNNLYDYSMDNIEYNNYYEPNNIYYNNNYIYQNQTYSFIKEQDDDDDQFLNNIILEYKRNKEIPPFITNKNLKRYTLVLDLEDTLINIKISYENKAIIRPRPGLIEFLCGIKPFYEIISFSKLSQNYSNTIIRLIEKNRKLFDYNLYREHCTLVGRKFVKDITRIGRDMKTIIMVDDLEDNLKDFSDNGILILPYDGDNTKGDRVLYELKKILILFYRLGYEDIRSAIKAYKDEIYEKITLGLIE